ncbi:MAG: hypothetical protein WD771_10985 [Gemmatimonadaceae bacterium]
MSRHRALSGRHGAPLVALALATAAVTVADTAQAQAPTGTSSDAVEFRAAVSPETVFVGQQATYRLTVRIPTAVRQRLRRNPEFVPPEARSVLAYDLPLARTPATEEAIEVHVFRRALFPLTPGRYAIPAARLSYALPQSSSFFSREEERTLRSEPVAFVAIDPPTRGRPADWLGAVGRWRATVRTEADGARVGDPFVLVLRLEGQGNAALLSRPAVNFSWADVVVEDERIVIDSTPTLLGGAKEFSWLVTPRLSGVQRVPEIGYTYFDPDLRRYVTARAAPVRVQVRDGDLVSLPPRKVNETVVVPLTVRPTLAGPSPVRLPGSAWWLLLAAVAPVPWATRRLTERRRLRVAAARAHAQETRRRSARAQFDAAVQERTGIAMVGVTAPGEFSVALRLEGVSDATAAEAESLRDAFDAQAFAPGAARASGGGNLRARAESLLERIDREARRRALPLLLLALLGVGACQRAVGDEAATRAFAEGTTAFVGADYARARDAFLRSAQAAPRDANAWANLGTAAWQAGDTATAVLGWQRALRLAPLNQDLRTRLRRVRAPQLRGIGRVWPVPPLPLVAGAIALWCVAWGWMARRAWGGRGVGVAPRLLLIPALGLAAVALWADAHLRARDLVVVARAGPLLALPALGADPGPVPLVGEIARVRERRGVWLRIELGADRSGWYPTERTHSLTRD